MSKHTPGPWQIHLSHIYGPDPQRQLVAQVWYRDVVSGAADARLISAAPDLLEALESIIQSTADIDCMGDDDCPGCSIQALARAAIAKAKGE